MQEQKLLVRLVPHINDIPQKNGPLIPLQIALESLKFKNNCDDCKDILKQNEISFHIYSNPTTTWYFAHCLTKIHTINKTKSKFTKKILDLYLNTFTNKELVDLINTTNQADCLTLQNKLTTKLCSRIIASNKSNCLKNLHPDVLTQIIPIIAKEKFIETGLLTSYANALSTTQTLHCTSFLEHAKQRIAETFSFAKFDVTNIHYINTNTKTTISSTYTPKCNDTDTIKTKHIKITKNQQETILDFEKYYDKYWSPLHIIADNDESLFICETADCKSKYIINYNKKNITILAVPCCFTHQNDNCQRLYYIKEDNTMAIKDMNLDIEIDFDDWNRSSNNVSSKINGLTVNHNGNIIALHTNGQIFIGTRTNKNSPFIFTLINFSFKNAFGKTIQKTNENDYIVLDNTGDTLFIIDKKGENITVINVKDRKNITSFLTYIQPKNQKYNEIMYTPLLIQEGKILMIKSLNRYIFFDTKSYYWWTKDICHFDLLGNTHNHEKIIQKKMEYESGREKRTMHMLTIIDNNIKKLIDIFHSRKMPLIYVTLALKSRRQLSCSLYLNDENYKAYKNLSPEEQNIIHAIYTIFGTSWYSYFTTKANILYKKYFEAAIVFLGFSCFFIFYIVLQQKYPGIFNYVDKFTSIMNFAVAFLK